MMPPSHLSAKYSLVSPPKLYVVAKADQERKANVIRAEGEAEAAQLISKAM